MNGKSQDSRLVTVYDKIDAGTIDVLSIDIFDTLLWRKVVLPVDVFLILGKRLKTEGWLIDALPAEGFVELRYMAEQLTRTKKAQALEITAAEVTLQEIYWNLSGIFNIITAEEMIQGKKGIINESDTDELASMEVALERQLTVYDHHIVELAHYAWKKKIPVILVSNTYFNQEQINTLLDRPNSILPYLQKIYLSCEYGYGKANGLFSKIFQELKISPKRLLHIGDNFKSDVLAAQQSGAQAVNYQKYSQEFSLILNHEWASNNLHLRSLSLDNNDGDYSLSSLRAKLYFSTALQKLKKKDQFFWKYGASVFGPVITGMTHWIYERCKTLGVSQVFCLMREGRLYADIIKTCACYHPDHPLEAKELWLTRHYIKSACLFYGSHEELTALMIIHRASRFTIDSFCAYLNIDLDLVPEYSKYRHVLLEKIEFREEFAKALSVNETIRAQIVKNSNIKRAKLMKYLSTLVDLSTLSEMVLIDTGWHGTIQGALQAIFQHAGYSIKVHGLYLGTTFQGIPPLLNGQIREGFLLKLGYPCDEMRLIGRGHYVLEQIGTSNLGILEGYDNNGNVVIGDVITPESQNRAGLLVQEGIKAFADYSGKYIQSGDVKLDFQSEALMNQLRQILVRATGFPTPEEVENFGNWQFDHVTAKDNILHILAEDKYYQEYIKHMLPENAFKDREITWATAYAAKQSEALTLMAKSSLLETIPKKCFLSEDVLLLKVFLDTKSKLSTKPAECYELHSNANRCFYTYTILSSIERPITQIRLEFEAPLSLFRVKSLRIKANTLTDSKLIHLIFFESDTKERGIISSIKQTTPSTFKCTNQPLTLTVPFNIPNIYRIQIHLCCEKFKI